MAVAPAQRGLGQCLGTGLAWLEEKPTQGGAVADRGGGGGGGTELLVTEATGDRIASKQVRL